MKIETLELRIHTGWPIPKERPQGFWVIEGDHSKPETWRLICPFVERAEAEQHAASMNRHMLIPTHFVEVGDVDPTFHPMPL